MLAAKPGETIGNYRLLGKLGSGGMGVVYAAEHVLLGRRAAIKFLRPEVSSDPTVVERFFTEARAASSVRHPGIVEVHDFGYHDRLAYLVMEYLEGETLRTCLRAEGRISPARAVPIALHIASALEAAHSAGVVHRDLKPDNVFLAKATAPDLSRRTQQLVMERVCILDFGVAKLVRDEGEGNPNITTSDVVVGTPTFMSPEQCRGGSKVDGRSDLYALGCILYAMLCARPPFVGTGSGEVLAQHIYQAPDPPRWYAPDITADLEGIILRLLEKEPARRFQSAHELARALRGLSLAPEAVGGTAVHGGPPPPAPAPPPALDSSPSLPAIPPPAAGLVSSPSLPSYGSLPHPRRSRAALLWTCGVLGVAFVAGAIALAATQQDGDQARPEARPEARTEARTAAPAAAPPAVTLPAAARADAAAAPAPALAGDAPPKGDEMMGMVRLVIDSEPQGAEVFRAGQSQRLGRTPYSVKQPPEPGYASFELRLPGYEPEVVSMRSDKSSETRATLRRIAAARPAGSGRSKKKPAAPAIKDTRRTTGPDEPPPPAPASPSD